MRRQQKAVFDKLAYKRVADNCKEAKSVKKVKLNLEDTRMWKLRVDMQKGDTLQEDLKDIPCSQDLLSHLQTKGKLLLARSLQMHELAVKQKFDEKEAMWWDTVARIRSFDEDMNTAEQRVCAHNKTPIKDYSTLYDHCLEKPEVKEQ